MIRSLQLNSACHTGLDPASKKVRLERVLDSPSTSLRTVSLSNGLSNGRLRGNDITEKIALLLIITHDPEQAHKNLQLIL